MRGKTFRVLKSRRPVRRLICGLSRNRAGFISRRRSARAIQSTGMDLLRHELRIPLTGILGMSGLLRNSRLAGEQRQLVLALQASGRQMERLVERMLTAEPVVSLTRVEAVNGLKLLDQVMRAHGPAAMDKGIGLHLVFDHRLAENWYSDVACLRQLLDNLLANAIKFTHRGYVLVEARSAGPDPHGKGGIELQVRDTGIGIARSDGRRIYSIREQGSADVVQRYGGSGLGLFVCERITGLLGGSVQHRSEAGGGTCFKVVLPGIADPAHNTAHRLRPALLAGLECQLGLGQPVSRVVTHCLRRIGVKVSSMGKQKLRQLPGRCDAVICDSRRIGFPLGGLQSAAGSGRPVLLSRYFPSAAMGWEDEHGIRALELPQPILQSNLEPLLLQLALQRAMSDTPGSVAPRHRSGLAGGADAHQE